MRMTNQYVFGSEHDIRGKLFNIYVRISMLAIVLYILAFVSVGQFLAAVIQTVFLIPFVLALKFYGANTRTIGITLALSSSIGVVFVQTFFDFHKGLRLSIPALGFDDCNFSY